MKLVSKKNGKENKRMKEEEDDIGCDYNLVMIKGIQVRQS
jgi:hypothetical protein